jgi:cephalosporin-C deacetylase
MTGTPQIVTDRADALYSIGETIVFRIPDTLKDAPYRITWDGKAIIETGIVDTAAVRVSVDEPGFVRLSVGAAGAQPVEAAAAVAPHRIAPTLPAPEGFDEFWQRHLARLPADPPQPVIEPHSEHETGRILKVTADTGKPEIGTVYGWLHVPNGPGPFPAILRYNGAGVYGQPAEYGSEWTERGWMCFSINAHSVPNDQPEEYYRELSAGGLAGYHFRGRDSRDTSYFVPMFLRAVHALNVVANLPEWDGTNLVPEGHSQGGGQVLAAAALSPLVTGLITSCPTHCDHAAPLLGRPAGWPKVVDWSGGAPNAVQL